jgi:hypothetical protein
MNQEPTDTPVSRPVQDAFWLARLESEGVNALITTTPALPPAFPQCLQQLNDGLYFEAHESLESIWLEAPYPMKLFYYALIKTAVGLLQIERHNANAATTQLTAALHHLAPFTPTFMAVQIDSPHLQLKDRVDLLQDGEDVSWEIMEALPKVSFQML